MSHVSFPFFLVFTSFFFFFFLWCMIFLALLYSMSWVFFFYCYVVQFSERKWNAYNHIQPLGGWLRAVGTWFWHWSASKPLTTSIFQLVSMLSCFMVLEWDSLQNSIYKINLVMLYNIAGHSHWRCQPRWEEYTNGKTVSKLQALFDLPAFIKGKQYHFSGLHDRDDEIFCSVLKEWWLAHMPTFKNNWYCFLTSI